MSSGSIRIIQLPEKSSVNTDDYMAVDSSANGTKKIKFTDLLDNNLSTQNKAADAQATGEAISELNTNINNTNTRIDNMINTQQNASVTTLWTGSIDKKNQTATLSESIANFDFVDIYIGGTDTVFARKPVSSSVHFEIQIQNMSDDASVQFLRWFETGLTISGTTATIDKAIRCYWDDFSTQPVVAQAGSDGGATIIRIDGVKIGHVENDEIVDARVGTDGTIYPTLGDAIRGQVADLESDLKASDIPWEIGGVTTAGLNYDATRGRMGVTIKTSAPIQITTSSYIVSYVYDLSGNYLSGESNISWTKTSRTIKADRLFRLATRKDDNSNISTADLASLVNGITFTFGGQGAEVFLASKDNKDEIYPTLGDAIRQQISDTKIGDSFLKELVALLKNVAYISGDGSTLINSLINAYGKETVATIYNFEPRMVVSQIASQGYIGSNSQRMTTRNRCFPIDNAFNYYVYAKLNTSSKVWVSFHLINSNALSAIENGTNYSASDFIETAWTELIDGVASFNPSQYTVNSLPVSAVRINLAFGDSHNNTISLIGTEVDYLKLQRMVNINE